jgi:hypothetical protein
MRGEGFIRAGLELKLELVGRVEEIIPAIARVLDPSEAQADAEVTAKF